MKVQAYSNVSGSPVDEKTLLQVSTGIVALGNVSIFCVLQLHSDELLVDIQDKIMEATVRISAPPTTDNCSHLFPFSLGQIPSEVEIQVGTVIPTNQGMFTP